MKPNRPTVIFVGRVNEAKGSEYLYDAIKALPNVDFLVVGSIHDDRFKDLKADNYHFVGEKTGDDLVELYNAADLGMFVYKISGAGLGQTTQEALACSVPVLISERKHEEGLPDFVMTCKEDSKDVIASIKRFFEKGEYHVGEIREWVEKRAGIKTWTPAYREFFLGGSE